MTLKKLIFQVSIRLLLNLLIFSLLLLAILTYRAYVVFKPCQHNVTRMNQADKFTLEDQHIKRLQKAISIRTESLKIGLENIDAKINFVNFIKKEFNDLENYPFVKLEVINNYSLLYKIEGTNTSLKPYLLAAHFDVVPADSTNWSHDPFVATIEDQFLYGRGTMDDKASMLSQLDAIRSFLTKSKQQPKRTIYLAYGHDEEITGLNGAGQIAKRLGNISLEYVLDEGTMVIDDLFPGSTQPIALISIAEKGYLTIKFYVNVTGGHSSMPNSENSSISILSQAITRLKDNKCPSMMRVGPEKDLLEALAMNFGFVKRVALTNIWLFKPLLEFLFAKSPSMDAIQRTTTAVTIFQSGHKDNVLPAYAEFVVNHRIHSLQSCAEIVDFDLEVINDPRIKYEVLDCIEPSYVSPSNSLGFKLIEHATMKLYPDASVSPSIMLGLTDSRFYVNLTKNVYKYLPIKIKNDDLKRYHGVDERISLENYENMINFYQILFNETDNAHLNEELNRKHTEL